jgi:hypothetical protein
VVMVMAEPIKQKDHVPGHGGHRRHPQSPLRRSWRIPRSGPDLEAYVVDNAGRLVTSVRRRQGRGNGYGGHPYRAEVSRLAVGARASRKHLCSHLQKGNQNIHDARHLLAHAKVGLGCDCPTENQRRVLHGFRNAPPDLPEWGLLLVVLCMVVGFHGRQGNYLSHRYADADGALHRPAMTSPSARRFAAAPKLANLPPPSTRWPKTFSATSAI